MYDGLQQFCERITTTRDPEAPLCYVRIRQGKSRTGYLIASKIDATGRDPVELSNELWERVNNAGDDTCWLEALHKGGTNPVECFKIVAREDGPKQESPADRMALVVERMARSADERANNSDYRLQMAYENVNAMTERMCEERIKYRELELADNNSFGKMVEMAAPVLAVTAAKFLAPKSAPASEEEPGDDVGATVDSCLDYLSAAIESDPSLITEERIEKMAPIVQTAMGLS